MLFMSFFLLLDYPQAFGHRFDHIVPPSRLLLSKHPRRRIPRRIVPVTSHRQQPSNRDKIHTGLFSAPATCATDVSTVITRSSSEMIAAVSAKSRTCSIGSTGRIANGIVSICRRVVSPFCKLTKRTSDILSNGRYAVADSERRRSVACALAWPGRGSPAHTSPTFKPSAGTLPRQRSTSDAGTCRYGTVAGIVSTIVPQSSGRLMIGHA